MIFGMGAVAGFVGLVAVQLSSEQVIAKTIP
jgi:hypothetical protein